MEVTAETLSFGNTASHRIGYEEASGCAGRVQERRSFAAEAEGAVREVTRRLGEALPEEGAPDGTLLGAVDRLTGLRNWGRSMLCRLR